MFSALHDYSFLVSIVGFPKNMTNFETIVWDDVVENPGFFLYPFEYINSILSKFQLKPSCHPDFTPTHL